jgi:phospholipid-transporting ATPase
MALAWWPAVSPFDPWGATLALAFVLLVSAIKALVEDAKRHRDDWATNARATRVMCGDGAFRDVAWRTVRVGDMVLVRDDEELPADLLCVYAALPERVCYVQTTNLGARPLRNAVCAMLTKPRAGAPSLGMQTGKHP